MLCSHVDDGDDDDDDGDGTDSYVPAFHGVTSV